MNGAEDRFALRPGEVITDAPMTEDAVVQFIGTIHTPYKRFEDCPRQGDPENGPLCRIELHEQWVPALQGLEKRGEIDVLYWLDRARRDLLVQTHRRDGTPRGTFALRSPVRPNPIGLSRVKLNGIEGGTLLVRGLDCLDGTPVIDIKPVTCHASPASDM